MEFRFSLRTLIFSLLFSLGALGADLPKDSLYQASTSWISASGKVMSLAELRGKPVLITMIYTKCKYTCPMMVTKLKAIEKAIVSHPDIKIVLVSFDHKNDTPAVLKKFMQERNLDENRWLVLTGKNSGSVRKLAALLDITYKQDKDGEYSHNNVISLLDRDGVKRGILNGIAADHSALVKAAEEMQ
ncbi:MAG: SCO family protein [Bdellovibrionota bacterium]